jgi:hypothetical protein
MWSKDININEVKETKKEDRKVKRNLDISNWKL